MMNSTPSNPLQNGVLYFHAGTKYAARLLVSMATLREHYSGPVCILSAGTEAARLSDKMAADPRLNVGHRSLDVTVERGRLASYLFKTTLHRFTPFERTVYLDCDTLITGEIAPLFELPSDRHIAVTQFCDWRTAGGRMARRIRSWTDTHPELVPAALEFGPAINTGIFAFTPHSTIWNRWNEVAVAGQHHFIPDELALQLLLPVSPHVVLDGRFNCSIKYGTPNDPETRIVHCHGHKHLLETSSLWQEAYAKAESLNLGNLRSWTPGGDKRLKKYLKQRDRQRNQKSSISMIDQQRGPVEGLQG